MMMSLKHDNPKSVTECACGNDKAAASYVVFASAADTTTTTTVYYLFTLSLSLSLSLSFSRLSDSI